MAGNKGIALEKPRGDDVDATSNIMYDWIEEWIRLRYRSIWTMPVETNPARRPRSEIEQFRHGRI